MKISPEVPAPLKALLILGVACIIGGMELSKPVPLNEKKTQPVEASQTSSVSQRSSRQHQADSNIVEALPAKTYDR